MLLIRGGHIKPIVGEELMKGDVLLVMTVGSPLSVKM